MKTTISILFMLAGAAFAGEWQRNTFPGRGHVDNGFAPGAGWSHMQDTMDVSVSPLDPDFRAMLDNESTAVYTEDTFNWKPLRMPHIGSIVSRAQSVEFSRYDADTMYLLVAHQYWQDMDPTNSPAGVWRSADRGTTWEHLYQPPAGSYEHNDNNTGRTHMLEDPCPLRTNHLYFGSTSDGLLRSTDGGSNWETVVPELSNRRIKTVVAAADTGNETVLYAIAEKIMPRHTAGNAVPLSFWAAPSGNDARWRFEGNLNDSSGNGNNLSGTVGYTASSIESYKSAVFNGGSSLNVQNLTYAGTQSKLSVTAWVKTQNPADQAIVSFDSNEYWELGMGSTGRLLWTVRDSGGTVNELIGPRIDDGDWHHVVGVFDGGAMRLYVDGDQVKSSTAGTTKLGSGATVNGVVGSGFNGNLDDVRIYNSKAFSLSNVRAAYLENERKNPLVQGQLWRIRIDASGNVSETVRLDAPMEDFYDVEVNPLDPSRGWIIRKGFPNTWPFGGRELYTFTAYGETLQASTAVLGNSVDFYEVAINPNNTNHVFLVCETKYRHVFRWSMDGGATWQGLNRKVGDYLPSFQSWLPMDYKDYGLGVKDGVAREHNGAPFSFVPGVPNEIVWISPADGGLMRTMDYGATWSTYAAGGPNKNLGQIAVAQSDPDRWSVAFGEHGWSVTTNNGLSWTAATYRNTGLLNTVALQAEADGLGWTAARFAQGVAYHPTNPDIMVATWTGNCYILRSTDAGVSWSDTGYRNPQRLGVDVFWSRTDPNRVYAGRMKSDDAGVTWSDMGKVVISVCDSDSDLIVGVNGMRNDVTQDLNLYVSSNGGASWTILPDPPRETVPGTTWQWGVTCTSRHWGSMADALVAIDPGASSLRILLAGRSGIYEYNEGSNAWTLRNTGLENSTHFNLIEPVPWMGFVAFDPRPGFEHIVYAASQNDYSTQGAWASEANPNHAYPGGENVEPFYRSMDGGITWTKLHGAAYPDAPGAALIESMTVDSLGRMFAATTEGIYTYTPPVSLIEFTSAEGYADGELVGQSRWSGNAGTFTVDTASPGSVWVSGANSWKKAAYEPIPSGMADTMFTLGASLNFTESAAASNVQKLFQLQFDATDGSSAQLNLKRLTDGTYQLGFFENSNGNSWEPNAMIMDAADLGTVNAPGSVSDTLYLQLSLTKGATAADWTAHCALYNLSVDPGMQSPMGAFVFSFASSTDFFNNPLTPAINSAAQAAANITDLRLESVGFVLNAPVGNRPPVFASDPIVKGNAPEGLAYSATLADAASDPDSDSLTFAKVSGPAWLTVGANGDLSGTPAYADVGLNSFTVEVYDGHGGTGITTLEITVVNVTSVLIEDSLAARVGGAGGTTGTEVRLDTVLDAGIYGNGFQAHPVFVFQMTGVAAPEDITNANFSVGVTDEVGPVDFNTDAYVIRKDASSTILSSDYETTAQLLMSGFSESGDGVGTVSLDAAGQSTLVTWLKNNWVDGEYVFIGLQTDPLSVTHDSTTKAFRYGSSSGGGVWAAGSTDARLEISIVDQQIADVVTIDDASAGRVGHGAADPAGFGTGVNTAQVLDAAVYGNGYQAHPVFVFQMTGVTVPATITNANFSVSLVEKVGTFSFNADAHVIRKDASSTILASDYETTAQSLMTSFSESGDGVGTVSLDTAGQSTLGTWLKNNWADGEYVFIGLKTAPLTLAATGSTMAYRYGGANGVAWSADATDARLVISVADQSQDFYTLWAQDNGVGAMDEDFDEDGLNNLGEYALKGDPKDPDDQGLTAISTPGGTFAFMHAMLSDPNSGVEYYVEVNDSGDLVSGGWTHAGITVTSGALDADYDLVTNAIPMTGSQNFIRLQINER